jgi:hypothetical protein
MRTTRPIPTAVATALAVAALGTPTAELASAQTGDGGARTAPSTVQRSQDSSATETPVNPGPPTWPVAPQTIPRPHQTVDQSASGLDWDSAGIGAGTVLGAFAIAGAGVIGLRRRRVSHVGSLTTH